MGKVMSLLLYSTTNELCIVYAGEVKRRPSNTQRAEAV
jgi:hypothetical protein